MFTITRKTSQKITAECSSWESLEAFLNSLGYYLNILDSGDPVALDVQTDEAHNCQIDCNDIFTKFTVTVTK